MTEYELDRIVDALPEAWRVSVHRAAEQTDAMTAVRAAIQTLVSDQEKAYAALDERLRIAEDRQYVAARRIGELSVANAKLRQQMGLEPPVEVV